MHQLFPPTTAVIVSVIPYLQMVQEQGRISIYKKICGKDQYVVSVTIMKPEESDGGQWRCNAFNPFGDSNANIALNFESKYIFGDFRVKVSSVPFKKVGIPLLYVEGI